MGGRCSSFRSEMSPTIRMSCSAHTCSTFSCWKAVSRSTAPQLCRKSQLQHEIIIGVPNYSGKTCRQVDYSTHLLQKNHVLLNRRGR
jgi:hypothetical protein